MLAVTFTLVAADGEAVESGTIVEDEPAGTVTLPGAATIAPLDVASVTTAPLAGAGAVSVIVAEIVPPPVVLVGEIESAESSGADWPLVPGTKICGDGVVTPL